MPFAQYNYIGRKQLTYSGELLHVVNRRGQGEAGQAPKRACLSVPLPQMQALQTILGRQGAVVLVRHNTPQVFLGYRCHKLSELGQGVGWLAQVEGLQPSCEQRTQDGVLARLVHRR